MEFPDLSSRGPYPSYPPGYVLPIYLTSVVVNQEPNPVMLMSYNLVNHLLIAFFLSLTIFFFLRQLKFSNLSAFLFAVIPILIELLLPPPLYFHQNVYFADQAVILPFVLFIFLEVIKKDIRGKSGIGVNLLQGLVLFLGVLTDWLFIFVALAMYLKRLILNDLGKSFVSVLISSFKFWFPVVLALFLFIFQLYLLDVLPQFFGRFNSWTGLCKLTWADFNSVLWGEHISRGYSKLAVGLLWGSLGIFILAAVYLLFQHFKKRFVCEEIKRTTLLIGILLVPCFLQVYAVKCHSITHNFSVLKFSVPLATVPFVLVPVLLYLLLRPRIKGDILRIFRKTRILIVISIVALVFSYLGYIHPRFIYFFPEVDKPIEEIGGFISNNTGYKDIVFSPDFEIPHNPPEQLSYSMKRVYLASSIEDIYSKVKAVEEEFEINIFTLGQEVNSNEMGKLVTKAYDIKNQGAMRLYKIKKEVFLEEYSKIKKANSQVN